MSNPYTEQLQQQGKEPSKAPATRYTFPLQIGARYFETEQQYLEALYEFMNGG